nr:MAG TPA: tail tape measure [Caudoviricetes sp.]
MSVRTIGVKIDGLNDIEATSKLLLNMKKTVLDIEKLINNMGKSNSLPFVNIKFKLNTDEIEKQIKSINSLADKARGTGKSPLDDKTLKRTNIEVHNVAESYKNLRNAVSSVDSAVTKLTSNMLRLGSVNPAKAMLGSFKAISSEVLGIQRSLASMVGGGLKGSLSGIVSGVRTAFRSGLGELNKEANNLGDAMQIYRINMQALGKTEKEINLSMKRLGDYGKASVFDATDLLEQASTFTAYNRTDAEAITKAFAGLTAQTKDPVQGMKTITTQVSQMLAAGVLNQQDFRFIRERFSALGASELNKKLTELAQSKGESSIVDATRKRLISADEFLDIVKQVGGDPRFQELVTSIITPRQAIANLKETLSNLLVFDKVDDEGNVTPGALNKVYVATREFIKGITEIVGSTKFEEYIRKFGDALGGLITKFSQVGRTIGIAEGSALLRSLETFGRDLSRGFNGSGYIKELRELSRSITEFFNTSGNNIGKFLGEAGKEYIKFLKSITDIGTEGIKSGFLDGITEVIKMYKNLADLAVSSGAIKVLSESFSRFFKVVNDVITTGANSNALKATVSSLGEFIKQLFDSIQFIGTKTTLIPTALGVLKSMLNFFTEVMGKIQKGLNPSRVNLGLKKIGEVINNLLRGLAPIVAELGSGLINSLTSTSGIAFFKALGNFIQSVVSGIRNFFTQMGGGSVEAGMQRLLTIFTNIVNVATTVTNIIGANARLFVNVLLFSKVSTWVAKLVAFVGTVTSSLSSVLGVTSKSGLAKRALTTGSAFGATSGSLYGAPAVITQGSPQAGLLRGAYESYKSARLDSGSRLQGLKAGFTSFKSGMSSSALRGIGRGALLVGGLVGDMVIDGLNGLVQDSGANNFVKKGAHIVSTTAKGALYGAGVGTLFGPLGTTIGAGLGALSGHIYGWFTKSTQQQLAEQEAEIKKQAKEEEDKAKYELVKSRTEAMREEGKAFTSMMKGFYQSITGNENSDLANSLATVQGISNQAGLPVKNAKLLSGLSNEQLDFNSLQGYSLRLNDQTKTWQEWKEQLGASDDELLATVQLLYGSVGIAYAELTNTVDGSTIQIRTLTNGEMTRQNTNVEKFVETLTSLGVTVDEAKKTLFKDLSSYADTLGLALNTNNFSSRGDQRQALIDALKQVGLSEAELKDKSITELKKYARTIKESADKYGVSAQEASGMLIDDIAKELKGLSEETVKAVMDATSDMTIEELTELQAQLSKRDYAKGASKALDKVNIANKLNEIDNFLIKDLESSVSTLVNTVNLLGGSDDEKVDKLTKHLQPMIKGIDETTARAISERMIKYKETLEEAIKHLREEGKFTPAEIESNKEYITNYVNAVGQLLKDGKIKVDEAKDLLKGVNVSEVSTTELTEGGKLLVESVKGKVTETKGTLGKIKSSVDETKVGDVDTSGISGLGGSITNALSDLATSVWDKISDIYNAIPFVPKAGASKVTPNKGAKKGVNNWAKGKGKGKKTGHRFTGGPVKYYSDGSIGGIDWVSRGTDTVPTMLTPGEYVLRKKAVDSLGTNFLDKLNKYGFSALQKGTGQTIINNVYNNNNAQISQNIDNKSQYLNGMYGIDKLMRYV